jgi:GT2 family glycosyltransferase/2-polyprenyl-3-methyl-5-hydroxy-6-metoxy-1,4-benzoquinol methylase
VGIDKEREGLKDHHAFIYDSPLDLHDANDPRAIAVRLIGSNKDVLELGPSTGRVTRVLHELGCRVVAIEIDSSVAENIRPYCSELIVGNVEQLPLREKLGDRRFDVILAGDFLEHLAIPVKLLQELKGYLTESGYLVASIPNIAHGSVRLSLLRGKFQYKDIGILDRTHLRFFTLESILRMLADAGFVAVDVQRVRTDPFKEPYVEGPSLDGPDFPIELRKIIESDPDASTVQFVLKAFPADSREAQSHLLLELESQLQEKTTTIARLETARLKAESEQLQKARQDAREAETQIALLDSQVQQSGSRIRELEEKLADVQRASSEARAANEALTFYLHRYKRIKDRFLPPGSFRERICRQVGLRILSGQTRSAKAQPTTTVELRQWAAETAPLDARNRIEPPAEWCDDPAQPPVVIAIPNWNRAELLQRCIESIFAKTKYQRFRICVYEQGSTDGSREYLQTVRDRVDVIWGTTNVGFVKANNVIVNRYPKWDLVFLNNDTEVTDDWLESLVSTAYKAENIGLVGSKLVYSDGRLQEAGSQVFQDGSTRAYGKFGDQWDPEFNQLREVDYCSAACLFAKGEVLDLAGGFDERYSPAYYEDVDLSFAVKAAGFKVIYEPRSTVIHHEHSTSGGSAHELMQANREVFVRKWASNLGSLQRNLWEVPCLTRCEKVLVIANIIPAPDRSAGGARFYEFVRLLARHYQVVLAYTATFGLKEYAKPLERFGVKVFYPGYAKAVHNYNLDLGAVLLHNDFTFVFFELFSMAEQYLGVVRQYSPKSVAVIDTYDVHFLRESREAATLGDTGLERKAKETKRRELEVYQKADVILTVTEEDKRVLLMEDGQLDVSVIPLIYPIPERLAPRTERRDLLFVGGFSHTPNVDAVLYLCHDIFPLVKTRLPQTKLYVVGNCPPLEIVALASDSIIVTGYVPHLTPYLESALVSVAPLRFGSGMKGKIGEAMAYGLPVVTTPVGAEGMQLTDGVDAMIANTPQAFAERVIRLIEEPTLWESIAKHACRRVVDQWSPDAVDAQLASMLTRHKSTERSIISELHERLS